MNYKHKVLLLLIALLVNVVAFSQNLNLTLSNVTVRKAMTELKQRTGYSFVYEKADLNTKKRVTVSAQSVSEAVRQILQGQEATYEIQGKSIIVRHQIPVSEPTPRKEGVQQQKAMVKASGRVADEKGEPIIGATVMEKGTKNGTVTDLDGRYTLDVPAGSSLEISYIGYQNSLIKAGDNKNIILTEDTKALDEVVVVGYGAQKRVDLTGSITSIDDKQISDRKVTQTSLALQGIAPGVAVIQRSGQPGADAGTIRIRGVGTLNNSDPLVLVDGIEMDLNTVDASMIESISVLKDAASASIYGSKAANGVILVTTKRGAQGNFNIGYSGYMTIQSATNLPKKVGALDHMKLLNEAKINAGAGAVYSDEDIQNWEKLGPSNRDLYPDTDWQDEVLKGSGVQQSHNITLQGGTDKLRAFASLNYINQKGIIKNIGYTRFSFRLNTDYFFTKNFSTSLDIFAYYDKRKDVASYTSNSSNGSGIGYVFFLMNKLPAVQAARYSSGLYAEGQNGENPVAFINQGGFYTFERTPVSANFSFNWKPIKELVVNGVFSPSFSYPREKNMENTVTTYNADGSVFSTLPTKSQLTETADYDRNLKMNLTATYNKTIKEHNFKIMAGMQYETYMIVFRQRE